MKKVKQIKAPKFSSQNREKEQQQPNETKLAFAIGFNLGAKQQNNPTKQSSSKAISQMKQMNLKEKQSFDNKLQAKKQKTKEIKKKLFNYKQIDSDGEEFLQTLEEGVGDIIKSIPDQKENQKKAQNGQIQQRGRNRELKGKVNKKRQTSKEFYQELAKCGGLLHEDATLRPTEAQSQFKNSLNDKSRQETNGPIIFPFQRRARSFSPKRELSFGGQVNIFNPKAAPFSQKDQSSTSFLNSSQNKIEPIKACAESFEKQKLEHQLQSLKLLRSNFLFAQNTSYLIEEPKEDINDPFNGILANASQNEQSLGLNKEAPKKKLLQQMEQKEDVLEIQDISFEDILKQIEAGEEFDFQSQL